MTIVPASAHPGGQHRHRRVLVAALAFLLGGLTVVTLYHFDVLGGTSDSAGSATEGSGVAATQAREVAAFQSVDLAGSNNVVIRVGEKQSVVVKADDNLLDRVTTEVRRAPWSSRTLRAASRRRARCAWRSTSRRSMR